MSTPPADPGRYDDQGTTSSDAILVISDGPGDTTPRPRPPNIPRYFPGREPPPGFEGPPAKPPEEPPPAKPEDPPPAP
jgi:hypothetical protein